MEDTDKQVIQAIEEAPERRAFYIDVGKMSPKEAQRHIEKVVKEFREKKLDSANG